MCLHASVKDGLEEHKPLGRSEGQLHKQLCLRICGLGGEEGDGKKKKKEAKGVITKQQETPKEKKRPVLTADFQTSCPILTQTAIKHDKFLNLQMKTKIHVKIAGPDWECDCQDLKCDKQAGS